MQVTVGMGPRSRPAGESGLGWVRGRLLWVYAVLAVPLAWVLAFVAWPSFSTLWQSLWALDAVGRPTGFAGLGNFRALFAQPLFSEVTLNTVTYAVAATGLSVAAALGLAVVLARVRRDQVGARGLLIALFSPTVMPAIAAANLWLYFLAPRIGVVDWLLRALGSGGENWLGQPGSALAVLVALFVWKYAPYFTLFLLAGMQAIPPNLRDALRLDDPRGFSAWRRVLLPLLAPMLLFVTVLALLYAVETVDPVYVMTQGGPNNATDLVMYYLYQLGFEFFAWGPAAALSALLMTVLSTLSGLSLIVLERKAFHW
ncbi:MAG: sugar ABC transporter permease [Firmicutes bacterium]|nr:sugar ABC transporter permease [Alicyclobacillaceae bacterium]MCL6496304.1 sugar ABC transporter permease [Bacillota bacterium]